MHPRLTVGVLALAAGFGASVASAQTILYVDDDAGVAGDGATWLTAYKYLQGALAVATSGDEIRIAQGTYQPDQDEAGDVTPGERTETFQLVSGVLLIGGYAGPGNPDDPNERDTRAYETVLSGDLAGDDGPDFANTDDNSHHVVTGSGTDATAVLDGVTVSGGNSTGVGGGMYISSGSPTLVACTFTGSAADFGGGICNFTNSSPTLIECTFRGNVARSTTGGGGAIYNYNGSSPTLRKCTFSENSASNGSGGGGAIRNSTNSNPVLINCAFIGNVAVYGGGMMQYESNPVLINCAFIENVAVYGGGMMNVDASPTLTNCSFADNSTPAGNGRALAFDFGEPVSSSHAVLTNCILWDGGLEIWNDDGSTIAMTDSNVLGGWAGEGNIDEDPLFADPDGGDYRLSEGSPCIDAGDNAVVTEPTDLDGNPRIVDGDGDATATVDMGAFEFQRAAVPTVSAWGLIAMAVLTVVVGGLVVAKRRRKAAAA